MGLGRFAQPGRMGATKMTAFSPEMTVTYLYGLSISGHLAHSAS